jgi:Protein of unknown function (DUF4236)
MPFYIRKSVSVGPFRFNLSKSGIGVSAGVTGFRVGTGPKGHYIHAGRGGLYYRSSISGSGNRAAPTTNSQPPAQSSQRPPPDYKERSVEMIRVSSADVLQMDDARFADILADLTAKQNSTSKMATLAWVGGIMTLLAAMIVGAQGFVIGLLIAGVTVAVGAWLDSFQRSAVLMYDLEEDATAAYQSVTAAFDVIMSCKGKWHVDAGGEILDPHAWKRNAGASHLLVKNPTVFDYSLPRVIKSNITPPAIKSGKETLYFLPDFLLVVDDKKVGAVGYDKLAIRSQQSNFIEAGIVPSDTVVLYHVWKHPNKGGGPDRRFADNVQLPVCQYEAIHLTSSNGLNELLEVSKVGVTEPFAKAITRLYHVTGNDAVYDSVPLLT